MNQAFIIRPNPHGHRRVEEFLSGNIIAIGWPGTGDLQGLSRKDIHDVMSKTQNYQSSRSLGQQVGSVHRFVNVADTDDLVLMPDGPWAYIGTIASDYYYVPSKDNPDEGYCHQRSVRWELRKQAIERAALPAVIVSKLSPQHAFFRTDHDLLYRTLLNNV